MDEKETKVCQWCEREFVPTVSIHRYCSEICYGKGRQRWANEGRAKEQRQKERVRKKVKGYIKAGWPKKGRLSNMNLTPKPEGVGRTFQLDFQKDEADSGGLIYVMTDGEFHKIGTSRTKSTLNSRLSSIQTANPREIRLLHTRRVHKALFYERNLHRYFGHAHVRREWFQLPGDPADLIDNAILHIRAERARRWACAGCASRKSQTIKPIVLRDYTFCSRGCVCAFFDFDDGLGLAYLALEQVGYICDELEGNRPPHPGTAGRGDPASGQAFQPVPQDDRPDQEGPERAGLLTGPPRRRGADRQRPKIDPHGCTPERICGP